MLSLIASLLAGPIGPYTSVGHDEVIKMEYYIGLGLRSEDYASIDLAWTDSYLAGVTLSEIKWGFYNTMDSGQQSSAFLEFTLHDIAGTTLERFILLQTLAYDIYFHGPDSSGNLWMGQPATYFPIPESCDLQFSQTQGFTYKFSARPTGKMATSKLLSSPSKITINGLNVDNVAHSNTFKDYLLELEEKWNKKLAESPDKANTAKIKLVMPPGQAANDEALIKNPVLTEKETKGQNLNRTGDPGAKILQIEFPQLKPLAEIIQELWQKRFVPAEESPEKNANKSSFLEVNYAKYEGGTNYIDIKAHGIGKTDNTSFILPVCIGTDNVCKGFPYRAELAAINFKGLVGMLARDKAAQQQGTGPMDPSQAGNQQQPPIGHTKQTPISTSLQKEQTTALLDYAGGLGGGANPLYDGWGNMGAILNKYRVPTFTMDFQMPYTYAFTPSVNGGLLPDGVDGKTTGSIAAKAGVLLFFWWYTDPTCQEVSLVKEFFTEYRISKVVHTIGLSGNTTQVSIAHLNAGGIQ